MLRAHNDSSSACGTRSATSKPVMILHYVAAHETLQKVTHDLVNACTSIKHGRRGINAINSHRQPGGPRRSHDLCVRI